MSFGQILHQLVIATPGRGFIRLDHKLNNWLQGTGIRQGVLHLTCLHTSASLTINENADPRVLDDLQAWMDAVVPQDGRGPINGNGRRARYLHDDEGVDDMPAHIRTALTSQTISLSIKAGRLLLGTWQAVYLWEHRTAGSPRTIACHVVGELCGPNQAENKHQNASAKPQTLLSLRNAERLNQAVQARHNPHAWETDEGIDTDTDLMIDRLHELSE